MAVLTYVVSPHGDEGRGLLGMTMERHWTATKRHHPAHWWVWTTRGRVVANNSDRPTKWRL
jgi:hypothetical protein